MGRMNRPADAPGFMHPLSFHSPTAPSVTSRLQMITRICPLCGADQQWEMGRLCKCGFDFGRPMRRSENRAPGSNGSEAGREPLRRRLAFVAAIGFVTFLAGILVYFSRMPRDYAFPLLMPAVFMFPGGLISFAPTSWAPRYIAFCGWIFYAGCIITFLRSARRKVVFSAGLILIATLTLNLYGCSRMFRM